MKKAIFILSLDCEGKWGMADHLNPFLNKLITNENLIKTYSRINSLLKKYKIPATFAFVASLLEDKKIFLDKYRETILGYKKNYNWLKDFNFESSDFSGQGWFCPTLLDIIKSHDFHEIGTHGFTHLPLIEELISKEDFLFEIEESIKFFKKKSINIDTIVYPRNLIGFVEQLDKLGIKGYRDNFYKDLKLSNSIYSFINEVNLLKNPQSFTITNSEVVSIPSGYILNFDYGWRRAIPEHLTKNLWKKMLDKAVLQNKVVHMWTHPHNFIFSSKTFNIFEDIISYVSSLLEKDKIVVKTQSKYSKEVLHG